MHKTLSGLESSIYFDYETYPHVKVGTGGTSSKRLLTSFGTSQLPFPNNESHLYIYLPVYKAYTSRGGEHMPKTVKCVYYS